jgi:hypothetical protein
MPIQPTQEAQEDFKALLAQLMPSAERTLEKDEAFPPFAAAVSTAGKVSARPGSTGTESLQSEDVIADLLHALRAEANSGAIRASGICADGWIVQEGKKVRAVIVSLEHVCGFASKVCIPCLKNEDGEQHLGKVSVLLDNPRVFG